ncbi:hypothetical protein CPB85DRAFT_1305083 [Mucidula mucida]|nr:hypothetical protein CPB85DRAFT_1305083 [Mucidula mucida]
MDHHHRPLPSPRISFEIFSSIFYDFILTYVLFSSIIVSHPIHTVTLSLHAP